MTKSFYKTFLTIISICLSLSLQAFEVKEAWNSRNQKIVSITCFNNTNMCDRLCRDDRQCNIPEPSCTDCVGTSIYMTYLFQEMGRYIRNTHIELDDYALIDLLDSGRFISLSAKSVYNHVDSFNSFALQRRFRSMCSDGTPHPVVFLDQNRSGKAGQPIMVWCESGVYEVVNQAEIEDFNSILY